jgi:carboxylate-amine ligase
VWWWELRPHPTYGTLELRVPDAQATAADSAAIVAVTHALAADLARRHEDGEPPLIVETWRIEENRWRALSQGAEAQLADLQTGEPAPARDRLLRMLERLAPWAEAQGSSAQLGHARTLVERGGAVRQRAAGDPQAATAWLADAFLE